MTLFYTKSNQTGFFGRHQFKNIKKNIKIDSRIIKATIASLP